MSGSECLNESNGHTYKKVLTSGSQYLESDCDEHVINEWMNEWCIMNGWIYVQIWING